MPYRLRGISSDLVLCSAYFTGQVYIVDATKNVVVPALRVMVMMDKIISHNIYDSIPLACSNIARILEKRPGISITLARWEMRLKGTR
jgi:hypothetical protein